MTSGWHHVNQEIKGVQTGNAYITEEIIETGGMGLVAIARRVKDGHRYALKTPRSWPRFNAGGLKWIRAFKYEALVWITLGKHRHVVQAHWFDQDERYRPFLVMEYVAGHAEGTSLKDVLATLKRLDVPQALRWTLEALLGLRYAKQRMSQGPDKPFIHRDIKPDNLLITADGLLKVTDFGLVGGGGMGTPPYIPPEQWEGQAVEEKSDVYALGCVLYEMLAGFGPFMRLTGSGHFKRVDAEGCKKAHFQEKPPAIRGMPDEVNRLLQRCLEKEAGARPGFVKLQQELLSLLSSHGCAAAAICLDPEPLSAEDQNGRGSAFHQLGDCLQALACFADAITREPGDIRFYLNRGNAYAGLKDLNNAEKNYQQVWQIDPECWQALLGLGYLQLLQHQPEAAEGFFQEGRRRFPQEPTFLIALGNLYGGWSRFSSAATYFRLALNLNPNLAEAFYGLGNIFWYQRDLRQTEKNYRQAINLNPLYLQVYENLARLYDHQDRFLERDQALELASLLLLETRETHGNF